MCDGTAASTLTNLYCEVSLSLLIDPVTMNLEFDDEVVVKARAKNFNGFGLQSLESSGGALIVAAPSAPAEAPLRDKEGSTETSILVEMPEVDSNSTGGLPILAYTLEWNLGGTQEEIWSSLVESSARTFDKTGLSTGTVYKFRYRVKNEVGVSEPSPVMMTYAGKEASTITITSALIDASEPTHITFAWEAPNYLGGLPITAYIVEIRAMDGTYFKKEPECDGTLSTIVDARECRVALTDLIAEPFLLTQATLV